MTTIAITGHEGRIGSELVKRGYTPLVCDITNIEETIDTVSSVNPDVIIHCAAMTDVGWCETHEKEASKVNIRGTAHVMEAHKGRFIYLSTVHVFDGMRYHPYSEKHEVNPLNAYGITKFAGEAVTRTGGIPYTIIRISKAFDYEWMKDTLGDLEYVNEVVFPTFITRSFVHTSHLVNGISYLAESDMYVNLLHLGGKDTLSYYDFWLQAARVLGFDEHRIIARSEEIEDYPRPFRGGLSVRKAKKLGVPLYSALDGLKEVRKGL